MKPTDIRIGNIVFNKDKKEGKIWIPYPRRIFSLNGIEVITLPYNETENKFKKINTVKLTDLEPIPLSDDWLFKMGFLKDQSGIIGKPINSINKILQIPFDYENEIRLCMPYYNGVMTIAKNIKYVHEVQNIYHSITREELIVNNNHEF